MYFRDGMVSTIGSVNVCDYQDFIIAPGCENKFYQALLDNLVKNKITKLHMEGIRTDSTIVKHLIPLAKVSGYSVEYHQTDISSDMPLPATWDDYLKMLDSKQRHELKRKIRKLDQTIQTTFRVISDSESLPAATEDFIKLFPESRGDKAEFMTGEIQAFFRSLAIGLTETGVLRYGSLELNGRPIAMVMFFDYRDNIYLYNSAYDPVYRSLSVGLISKAYCIRDAIEQGKKRFDFLKGAEVYKSRLGGQELPLYSCELTFEP